MTAAGKRVASAGDDRSIRLWDVDSKSLLKTITGHSRTIEGLAFSPDDQLLASASADGSLRLWNAAGDTVATMELPNERFKSVAFSPDGLWLVSGSFEGTVRIWSVAERRELSAVKAHTNSVYGVVFDSTGKLLATAGFDRTVHVWRVLQTELPN